MAANETRIRISKTIHLQNHSKFSFCVINTKLKVN